MTYGIKHLGRDITSSHSYQLYDEGSVTLAAGSYVGTYGTYQYSSVGGVYKYDFPVLPGTGINTGLTFIKPVSGLIGAAKRSDGGITLLATSALTVSYMRFVNSKIYQKPSSGYGMLVLANDGSTILLDMSKNNLVIRRTFTQVSIAYSSTSETTAVTHNLGYAPYILVNTVNTELESFVDNEYEMFPLLFRSTNTTCSARVGFFSTRPNSGSTVVIQYNVKMDYILTDGA